jgi:HTH-type transcriptional regulator / antitoxin HipB
MMHSDLDRIGEALRSARRSAQLSQSRLASQLGMSRATISGIENGTITEIGARKLLALCGALGLELIAQPKNRRPTLQELREEQRERANRP